MTRKDYYRDPAAPKANNIAVAVTAFILDEDDQVLMIRRTDSGLYSIPGAGQEVGETIGQTVVREGKEETGVDIEPVRVLGIYSDPEHVIGYTDGEVRQEFSICFTARVVGGELATSDESSEVLWIARDDLDALDIHPSIRLRIKHGYEGREEPYFS
jgi:ADP-ribose pyrophosphatase YjhB (NUDIX family)